MKECTAKEFMDFMENELDRVYDDEKEFDKLYEEQVEITFRGHKVSMSFCANVYNCMTDVLRDILEDEVYTLVNGKEVLESLDGDEYYREEVK